MGKLSLLDSLFQRIFSRRCIDSLLHSLGDPHHSFDSILVAGTNGKGSVACKIASGLELSGKRVGLFTSPHLTHFRERITINGTSIHDETIAEMLTPLLSQEGSFFELTTALALSYFAQQEVDVAVLEVGLGGRLDATNAVDPILSVITSVDLDHTELLGATREAIAKEKGGIIRPGIPLVLGPHATGLGLENTMATIAPAAPLFTQENRNIAKLALARLGIDQPSALEIELPGRFERVGNVLFDVAHNPSGLKRLLQALAHHYPEELIRLVVGFSVGKEIESMIEIVRSVPNHLVTIDHPRVIQPPGARPLEEVLAERSDDLTVVCGSCYVVGAARSIVMKGMPVG